MKKFLVLVLLVALMAGVASGAYYDNDGDSWETAYVIASSEDLMLMRNRVNSGAESDGKYYRLSADIDLTSVASWQSIGGTSRNFAGHFDGQGHTVALGSGGKLFGSISVDEGTIAVRNLNLSGKIDSNCSLATDLYSGIIESCSFAGSVSNTTLACGLVSQIWGGTIRNCTVSADISSTSGDAGGIVGLMSGGTAQNCTVKAGTAITASENAGGIAGNMIAGTVTNCTVEAGTAVTAQRYAGGIAGYAVNDAVFSGNNYPFDYTMIGNIPYWNGDNDGSSWEKSYVILSSGDLVVMHDRINAASDDEGKYYKLSADIDLTSITGWRGIGNGNNFTGHFDGQSHTIRLNGAKGLFDTINADEGTIAVRNLNLAGTVASENDSCAALVMTLRSGIIENCSFTGTVRAEASYSGGLVGWMSGGTARNCTVSGDVFSGTSGENDFAGGIAGYIESGTVENCTVKAGSTITASGEAGGIAGFAEAGAITNCTVEDGTAITSSGHAGGIVGDTNTATLSGNTWPSRYVEVGSSIPDTTPQITWNGHRYQAYNENLTWEEAKSRCESLGGHLATITSSLEQEQVETLLRQSRTTQGGYWLGASADVSGFWKWTTDEEFERQYTNFPGGQQESSGNYLYMYWSPNSATNAVTASVASNPGEWDNIGNASYGFICEWDEEQEAIQEATTNSDFQRWQQDPDAYNNTEQSGVPAGSNPSPVDTSHLVDNPPNVEVSDIPVSFDARKEGRLLPVREQGIYQTCWAFAALGAMEADYMTSNMASLGTSPDLSELHLAWNIYVDA